MTDPNKSSNRIDHKLIHAFNDGVVVELSVAQRRAFAVIVAADRARTTSGGRCLIVCRETKVRRYVRAGIERYTFSANVTAAKGLVRANLVTRGLYELTALGRLLAAEVRDDVDLMLRSAGASAESESR